jgi:hypothetical protein
MMNVADSPKTFTSVQITAVRLGVPASWLRDEALAGRIPHLRVGRRILLNPDIVRESLVERAHQQKELADAS